MIRIGFGFDTHPLGPGKDFWLGGVVIAHDQGAVGHSDADVLIHAIIDALLGAAGLPDIGSQFPDTSAEFKGISSRILLQRTIELVHQQDYRIGNIDSTVVLQSPRIAQFIPEMRKVLCEAAGIDSGQLNIKAKTSEKLGFIGREEGVSAYAVVLLNSIDNGKIDI